MREHSEDYPVETAVKRSAVPGRKGKHDIEFKRGTNTNVESLTYGELLTLASKLEHYLDEPKTLLEQ